jgi:hypothetical protein
MRRLLAPLLVLLLAAACKKADTSPAGKRYAVQVLPAATTTVRVTPGPGWKLNLEYPSRLEARGQRGGEVKIDKSQAKLTEEELAFSVPADAQGSYEGLVYFAICNPQSCIPIQEKVRWTVAAK